jgi:tryptophan halogenase
LPCDSAVAVQTEATGPAIPYTRSIARESGWQWRIPLQSRVGNGMVYCSRYIKDDDARETLLANVEGELLTEPRLIKFRPGMRLKHWSHNCVAIGLASGFIEPLESTSIHLIQRGMIRLLQMFPLDGISQTDIDEFNKQTRDDIESIRDFIILHYCVTNRDDSPFWRYCRNMEIPEPLAHRIKLFRETGKVFRVPNELFAENSWIQVMQLKRFLEQIQESVESRVQQLPQHADYVGQYCPSSTG